MAYLGSSTRDRTTAAGARGPSALAGGAVPYRSRPADDRSGADAPTSSRWALPAEAQRATTFGAGLALGLTLGAGLALLLAPRTGAETRAVLRRSVRRAGSRSRDAWDDLRDELRQAGRRSGRRVRRAVQRGGWAAEDLVAERREKRRRARAMRMAADC